jgi:hypothetical protein
VPEQDTIIMSMRQRTTVEKFCVQGLSWRGHC